MPPLTIFRSAGRSHSDPALMPDTLGFAARGAAREERFALGAAAQALQPLAAAPVSDVSAFAALPAEIKEEIGLGLGNRDLVSLAGVDRHTRKSLIGLVSTLWFANHLRTVSSLRPLIEGFDSIARAPASRRAGLWRIASGRIACLPAETAATAFAHGLQKGSDYAQSYPQPRCSRILSGILDSLGENLAHLPAPAQFSQSQRMLDLIAKHAAAGSYLPEDVLFDVAAPVVQQYYLAYLLGFAHFPSSMQQALAQALPHPEIENLPPAHRTQALLNMADATNILDRQAQAIILPKLYWKTYQIAPADWQYARQRISGQLNAARKSFTA